MCFFKKRVNNNKSQVKTDLPFVPVEDRDINKEGYISGVYYSNWSPYKPRSHFPHDINFNQISHVFYAFFVIDSKTGRIKSSDTWSDFEMTIEPIRNINSDRYGKIKLLGCIGELFWLKMDYFRRNNEGFKTIMSVGGWSNRELFPKMVRSQKKMDQFIESCIDTMFKHGFDGIDLDWEFPKDDGVEPKKYLEIVERLRSGLNELERSIWGHACNRFHLSVATPAFEEKLKILLVNKMNPYINFWNMMTYDYYGEWSEYTGLHCNLYNGMRQKRIGLQVQYKHDSKSNDETSLNADSAIAYMRKQYNILSSKLVLGMAMYGRGFTQVSLPKPVSSSLLLNDPNTFLKKKFKGVGGESEGESGIWLYNQLPIPNSKEMFDPDHVAAYCVDVKNKILVGYDNVNSTLVKSEYIMSNGLAGTFWWESCGNTWDDTSRSLVNTYVKRIKKVNRTQHNIYMDKKVQVYYIERYGKNGFLTELLSNV
ncbi:putative chitinase PWA37_001506 [Arxiozyma heterogenica]|uniref:putative chitinase n=1 Tax=Arxiozyma heterogenica TaxID=278026 RepID=UPI002F0ECE5C